MDIDSAVSQLTDIISKTPEFTQFKTLHGQVSRDSHFSMLLSRFEAKQNQLYTADPSQEGVHQLIAELDKDYESLNAIPLMKQYFAAEEKIGQIIGSIAERLHSGLADRL